MNKKLTIVALLVAAALVGFIVFNSNQKNDGNGAEFDNNQETETSQIKSIIAKRSLPEGKNYLVDGAGMTLYIFTNDEQLQSNCTNACAEIWPPYLFNDALHARLLEQPLENVQIIERSDGSRQFAYNKMPLYYYNVDQIPGDRHGNGVNDVWFIVLQD